MPGWGRVRALTLGGASLTTSRVTLQIAACPNHPTREAIGICVSCRAQLCGACATKVEGINHCVVCLAALAQSGPESPVLVPSLCASSVTGAYLVTLGLLVWGLLELAFLAEPGW